MISVFRGHPSMGPRQNAFKSKQPSSSSQLPAKGSLDVRGSLPPIMTTPKATKITFGSLLNRRQVAARCDDDFDCMKDEDGSDCTASLESLSSNEDNSPTNRQPNQETSMRVRTTKASTTSSQTEMELRERARLQALMQIMRAMESSEGFANDLFSSHRVTNNSKKQQEPRHAHQRPHRSIIFPASPSPSLPISAHSPTVHMLPVSPNFRASESAATVLCEARKLRALQLPRKFDRRKVMMGMLRKIPDTVFENEGTQ